MAQQSRVLAALPPGSPADRRDALRKAFGEMIADAEFRELFEFGEATAQVMDTLALCTAVAVKPVTGNNSAVAEADAIWKPWKNSK